LKIYLLLKDASSTAIYGIRGANGVLVITTRRGISGAPRINVTVEYGSQNTIRLPIYMDSYTTAMLNNEARVNDNNVLSSAPIALEFSDRDIQLFKDGTDPYGHPNVNWVDAVLNKSAPQYKANIDISGGGNLIKYFVSAGVYSQDGMVKITDCP